jgi:hypothetical protein
MAQGNASPGIVGTVQIGQVAVGQSPSPYTVGSSSALTLSSTNALTVGGSLYAKGPSPWADVVAWGADPTGAVDSTTAIQNAINSLNTAIPGGIVFFPTGVYKISSTLTISIIGVTLMGTGASYSADVGSNSMGSALTWAGPANTVGSIMVKAFPPSTGASAPGLKGFRLFGLTFFANSGALIALQMISCQGFHIEDFYIQDSGYIALDMNVLNDSQTDAGERDTTRGVVRRGDIRVLDGTIATAVSTLAGNTNITTFVGAGTITTSTNLTSAGFPASGVVLIWILDPNGHYQQAAVAYTGITAGASASFTGCTSLGLLTNTAGFSPLGSLSPVLNTQTLTGLTTLVLANGSASMAIRLDGAPSFDVAYVDFEMIQCSTNNGVGVTSLNADDNYLYDIIVNRSAASTLTPPGMTFHGSTVSANYTCRNNTLHGGSAGVGGAVSYGTAQGTISTSQNNYGAITYTNPSLDTYWRDYGMANGEPVPGIGQFSWFWYNANSSQFGAPYNTLLGNARNGGISSITANSIGISTAETIVTAPTPVPFNSMVVGTSYRITLLGTCTTTAANASTFTLRFGTAGTTSDASIATAVTAVAATTGSAIPFRVVIEFTVRSIGTTGAIVGTLTLWNAGATGISAVLTQVLQLTATATLNTTVNSFFEVTYKSAATTTTCVFDNAVVEVVKA